MNIFGTMLVYGVPILLAWSTILTIIHMIKAKKEENESMIGTFIGCVYSYTISSFMAWLGIISILFAIYGIFTFNIIAILLFGPFGV